MPLAQDVTRTCARSVADCTGWTGRTALEHERLLAVARLVLPLLGVLALRAAPGEADDLSRIVLALYAAHSGAALAVVGARRETSAGFAIAMHAVDTMTAALLASAGHGSGDVVFAFILFVLTAAALRWDARGVIVTTAAGAALTLAPAPATTLAGSAAVICIRLTYFAFAGTLVTWLLRRAVAPEPNDSGALRLAPPTALDGRQDRVLQSLIGIEMYLHAIRRRERPGDQDLARIQEHIHQQVLALRTPEPRTHDPVGKDGPSGRDSLLG